MNMSRQDTRSLRFGKPASGWRRKAHTLIFESDTTAGRRFDVTLLLVIVTSVLVVILDSVTSIHAQSSGALYGLEWVFTIAFTIEYIVRLLAVQRPLRYAFSLFGVIDLLAILPTYIALVLPGIHYLIDVRILRLLRVFRLLKIPLYFDEAHGLMTALAHARRKIFVFFFAVCILVVILGTMMYVVEGPEHGFTSIPAAMYWAVVTLSTTGYGDLTPRTPLGQMLTSVTILLGYAIIALPTGIVGAELAAGIIRGERDTRMCAHCGTVGHERDAGYCRKCGTGL
ncbi:voltage-gated potassium channel [Luteibacter rhizovicinus]|uniref:Voltage-gated potassium channel n=1 Tax=Luteibacter rhizovicinus TaxID=242606 RepID=A0A4R3YQI6_9GAMM|nr:ion transporter [Luteibacter rhizovicinus]TCV94626.1 voltage-gated potassium channel [Luteibacter rhizovicinus]